MRLPRRRAAPSCGEDDVDDVPDDNLLILITGSQGEPRRALARIAQDTHPRVALGEGDTVVFSSRVIPGNERAITTVQDNLVRRGVRLMTDADHLVHVSGHPARDELRRLYRLVKPRYAVPVHGEWRHLTGACRTGAAKPARSRSCWRTATCSTWPPAGWRSSTAPPVGRLVVDGNRLVPLSGGVMAARRRMLFNGVAVASLAVDDAGRLIGRPRLSAPGPVRAGRPGDRRASAAKWPRRWPTCRPRCAATTPR